MKNVYNINFYRLVIQLLPLEYRKNKFLAVLWLVSAQLQKIHTNFLEFIGGLDETRKTQTCYLRAELNKWFDPYQKRILVETNVPNYDDYLLHSEQSGNYIQLSQAAPFSLQKEKNLLGSHINFKIILPQGFELTTQQKYLMDSLLQKNKLPSKTYTITHG